MIHFSYRRYLSISFGRASKILYPLISVSCTVVLIRTCISSGASMRPGKTSLGPRPFGSTPTLLSGWVYHKSPRWPTSSSTETRSLHLNCTSKTTNETADVLSHAQTFPTSLDEGCTRTFCSKLLECFQLEMCSDIRQWVVDPIRSYHLY